MIDVAGETRLTFKLEGSFDDLERVGNLALEV
jgi:hypothetical protein